MRLSAQQAQYLEALDWLYSDEARATGRTTLQALAILRKLCSSHTFPTREIVVTDHATTDIWHLLDVLRRLSSDVGLDLSVSTVFRARPIQLMSAPSARSLQMLNEIEIDDSVIPVQYRGNLVIRESTQVPQLETPKKWYKTVWDRLVEGSDLT